MLFDLDREDYSATVSCRRRPAPDSPRRNGQPVVRIRTVACARFETAQETTLRNLAAAASQHVASACGISSAKCISCELGIAFHELTRTVSRVKEADMEMPSVPVITPIPDSLDSVTDEQLLVQYRNGLRSVSSSL